MPLDADEPAVEGFRRVLLHLADAIEANLLGTIDATDPECLHELRVAVRRSRCVLGRAKGVVPEDVRAHHRGELGWLSALTGPARDLDVLLLEWDRYLAPLDPGSVRALAPVREELEGRAAAVHEQLSAGLRSERYEDLMAGWERWLRTPSEDVTGPSVGSVAARRIEAAQRRVLRAGRAITADAPPEALHDLRKDAKRLRYLLECFGSLLPRKPRKAFVTTLKDLQDNLGAHQDAEVHGRVLRSVVTDLGPRADPATASAADALIERLDRRRADEREHFARRFAAYDTPATALALDRLLERLRD